MKIIRGDLIQLALDGKFDIIIHGCNCFCTMGAGIARQIKDTFPEAYKADLKTKIGDASKLGTINFATTKSIYYTGTKTDIREIIVINAYTQFDYRGERSGILLADYEAIRMCFNRIALLFGKQNKRIGYPKIGAGLANGDWNTISKIIDEELKDLDHTLIEFNR